MRDPGNEVEKYSVKISGDGANMADSQENFSAPDLRDEETVLAIRLAEALRTDEVETFLEIYDSIPSTTETKRVSILISFTTCSQILLLLRAIERVKIFTNSIVTFFLRIFHVLTLWKKKETIRSLWRVYISLTGCHVNNPNIIFHLLVFARRDMKC